ncbi:MAG: hypothetical protein R6U78_00245, partial [Bacteroidales bacterium]
FLDNFQSIKAFGIDIPALSSDKPDKGHLEELNYLNEYIKNRLYIDEYLKTLECTMSISICAQMSCTYDLE